MFNSGVRGGSWSIFTPLKKNPKTGGLGRHFRHDEHDFDFIYHPSEAARSGVVARVTSAAGRGRGRGSRRLRGQSKILKKKIYTGV